MIRATVLPVSCASRTQSRLVLVVEYLRNQDIVRLDVEVADTPSMDIA